MKNTKIRALSMLWLCILGWPVQTVLAADTDPPVTRAVAPGEFSVKSIDEQKLPSSLKEKLRAQVRLMSQHKVIPVSDHEVPDFTAIEAEHRTPGKALSQLIAEKSITFSPADVDATSLRGQAMLGAITHGVQVNHSWNGLSRIFNHPHLGRVVLEETDLATANGGITLTKEMINADVNGAPAVLVSQQASERKSITSLSWFSHGMDYVLSAPGVDDESRAELLDIARRLTQ